jgi:hypothetical protein
LLGRRPDKKVVGVFCAFFIRLFINQSDLFFGSEHLLPLDLSIPFSIRFRRNGYFGSFKVSISVCLVVVVAESKLTRIKNATVFIFFLN